MNKEIEYIGIKQSTPKSTSTNYGYVIKKHNDGNWWVYKEDEVTIIRGPLSDENIASDLNNGFIKIKK